MNMSTRFSLEGSEDMNLGVLIEVVNALAEYGGILLSENNEGATEQYSLENELPKVNTDGTLNDNSEASS